MQKKRGFENTKRGTGDAREVGKYIGWQLLGKFG